MTVRRDVVIVGGGPAGLAAGVAILDADPSLAGRVVVLEKAAYPRDKYCAGALGGRGDAILARLGIRPDVPSVPIDGISIRVVSGARVVRVPGIGRVVRRIELDAGIAALAKKHGVEIIENAKVDRVDIAHDGATVESSAGRFEARVVVGCDGVGSVVRKAMGVGAGKLRAQVLELDTPPVSGDGDRGVIHFDASDRSLSGYAWDFPTMVAGEVLVCRGIYHLKVDDEDVDITGKLAERLGVMGLDIRHFKNKRFAERGVELSETFAKGGAMLAGESAGIDPITGEGIAQAIEYGAMVGPHVAAALRGDVRLESWSDVVRRSRLGWDLRFRARMVNELYGPRRAEMERMMVEGDAFLHAGCRHFGALPMNGPMAALAVGRLASYFARGVLGGG
jgi:flavin-dependent dehydrogenase